VGGYLVVIFSFRSPGNLFSNNRIASGNCVLRDGFGSICLLYSNYVAKSLNLFPDTDGIKIISTYSNLSQNDSTLFYYSL